MGYNNPTLIEIYVELFTAPGQIVPAQALDFATNLRSEGFPTIEFVVTQESLPLPQLLLSPRLRCWDIGKTKLIQLSESRVIINRVAPYGGWTEFAKLCKNTMSIANKVGVVIAPTSVLLATIDQFHVPRINYTLGTYLNCSGGVIPEWYETSRETIDVVLGKGVLDSDGFNRQVKLMVRPERDKVMLKIESFFHNRLVTGQNLMDVLDLLHEESTKSFESLVTDHTRQIVMGGTK